MVQVIDDQACEAIVNRFNAEADGQSFPGMLVDHEHFKHDSAKESRAYGWLMRLQNRADGIYGQMKWTTTGRAAVDGGDYRFFSTEYDPRDLVVVVNRGNETKGMYMRPVRLAGLTLTNEPNNKGGKPITNRDPNQEFRGAGASAGSTEQNNQRKTMKSVATKLGLSADASEDAVLSELTKIMNRMSEAETKIIPLTNRVTELETATAVMVGEQIDADLDMHGVKEEKVRNRLKPVLIPLKNRAERVAFLTDLNLAPAAGAKVETKGAGTVLNRSQAGTPGNQAQGGQEANSKALFAAVADYRVKNRCTHEEAWSAVKREKPELFKTESNS